jgi:hypothetical protein
MGVAAALACIPLAIAMAVSPVLASRHLPSVAFLLRPATWLRYWRLMPEMMGWPLLIGAAIGAALALATPGRQREARLLALWFLVVIVELSLLPARDSRYLLIVAPALVLAVAIGVVAAVERMRAPVAPRWQAAALTASLALALLYASQVRVPEANGFQAIAAYLRDAGPHDAVLYDGPNSKQLAFYVRAYDPRFERRLTEGRVAVQDFQDGPAILGRQLLREAVKLPDFEFARSFPITGRRPRHVDLYRLTGDVNPDVTLDLSFPSFNRREFKGVAPITR